MSNNKESKNEKVGDTHGEEINEEMLKEPLGEKISILHYIQNPNINENIESPKSKNAMKHLGFTMEDIKYLSFLEYINNNHTFIGLPKEIQKKRYEFAEQYRYNKIEKIKELRDALIEQELLNKDIKEKNEAINININDNEKENGNEELGSTAINEELKQFERLKRKNEMDLINAVEYELKRQIIIKEGEEKLRRQNMKNENYRISVEIKNEIEKKKNEERERKKEELRKYEEEELKKENLRKYIKEQRRAKLEEEKEKERIRQNIERDRLQEEKRKAFKEKVDRMNEEYNEKINQKKIIFRK